MAKPSTYGKAGEGPTVGVILRDAKGQAVSGAVARLIVSGIGQPTLQTDAEGGATWFVSSQGTYGVPKARQYQYVLTVWRGEDIVVQQRGEASAAYPTLLGFRLTASGTPESRFKNRKKEPVRQRTGLELIRDIAWSAVRTRECLVGTKDRLDSVNWTHRTANIDTIAGMLDHVGQAASTIESLESLEATWKHAGFDLKGAVPGAIDLVTTLYDVVEAYEEEDLDAALVALGVNGLETIAGIHPIGAMGVLAMQVGFGLRAALTPTARTKSAVVRQTKLSEFNNLGSCPVIAGKKQYRIDVTSRPYKVKVYDYASPVMVGLAFGVAHPGALVLVDYMGIELPIPTETADDVRRVRQALDYVHVHGW